MLGAIIGDIVGSAYEFHSTFDYNFKLFPTGCSFTDDTVCTIAVADHLLGRYDSFGASMHSWCRRYRHPKGGYGGRFKQWVDSDRPVPYGSFGNGSAMRVSPVGWYYFNVDDVLAAAAATADCTHNHPEGIKGAQTVALAIFLANQYRLNGIAPNAAEIVEHCVEFSGYDIDIDWDAVRGHFDETCQGTVPVALAIVRDSHSFEDAVRRAVSLGADADTLGAIVGSIAEPIWGIPHWLKEKAISYLPDEMTEVLKEFLHTVRSRRKESQPQPVGPVFTPDNIVSLGGNEIFVFGSNLAGEHMGGAAAVAHRHFGAVWGIGAGLTGQSYAIPTMMGSLEKIRPYVDQFTAFARRNSDLTFLVTRIGCGIAGYTDGEIAPMFAEAATLPNVRIPREFAAVLGMA